MKQRIITQVLTGRMNIFAANMDGEVDHQEPEVDPHKDDLSILRGI